MQRREFITAFGCTVAAWPRVASAQPYNKPRLIGVLIGFASNDPEAENRFAAFRSAFQGLGRIEGSNVRIEVRWAGEDVERVKAYAEELIALAPDVILCTPTPALAELSRLSHSIPIVFANVSDPVGSGFVSSLGRPGGNVTGFSSFEPTIGGKWLQLLKEIAPRVSRMAVLVQPENASNVQMLHAAEASGPSLGVDVSATNIRDGTDIERAVAGLATDGGLVVLPNPVTLGHRDLITALAAQHRLPAIYPFGIFPASGGLASYGFDSIDLWRRAAGYVDRILKGEKPADLPVQAPTKYELVINLKTAKALDLDVSLQLQQRADEVIE
jgi:putative tryptophan/tyrosine transport system substrate-binding protein